MTYQEEKEQQQELCQELAPQIAAILSDLLGETWTQAPVPDTRWRTQIKGPDGRGIHLRLDDGRLSITGLWPENITNERGTHSFYPWDGRPHITVAFNRGAEAIAKDINRRLLPKYLPMWEEMLQHRYDYIDENRREQELLAQLAAAGGVTHKGTEVRIWERGKINEPRATATVSFYPDADNPTVDLKLENIPPNIAKQILALVGQAAA